VLGTKLPHRVQHSPNFGERKNGKTVNCLILHYTGMKSAQAACDWLCNVASQVSCHYLIDEKGAITQMVDETMRAWHAGAGSWGDEDDINSTSIGVEIQNLGHPLYPDFPREQMLAVVALCKDITSRHHIQPRNILAHSDVAPGRKIDPGEKFDWALLHSFAIGHCVEPAPLRGGAFLQMGDNGDAVMALQAMLKLYGFGLAVDGIFGPRTKVVVEAFQRHFRQARVDGIADQSTVATLHRLLKS
jgi:N-acetylmuramoyl-L-alanine amidase